MGPDKGYVDMSTLDAATSTKARVIKFEIQKINLLAQGHAYPGRRHLHQGKEAGEIETSKLSDTVR